MAAAQSQAEGPILLGTGTGISQGLSWAAAAISAAASLLLFYECGEGAAPFEERARLCYLWDRNMIEQAELVIAETSFPSTGVGIEMQIAESKGTPIILCFRDFGMNKVETVSYENPDHSRHNLQVGDGFVTLMALGVPTIFKVIRYSDGHDGLAKITSALDLLTQA